ncbi:hypothetical protein BDW74DRAFT_150300 [Aspergillus multicolor]|uniref:uncharacterized protein n=1 Tax=Aspergillus multicolor TaxID=41759 RepID=UPI003CCDCA8B
MEAEPANRANKVRMQSIWWTLYILDLRFSTLIGALVSIHDSDITLGLSTASASHRCRAKHLWHSQSMSS